MAQAVRALEDPGTAVDSYDYCSTGNDIGTTGTVPNAFHQAGGEYDPGTKQYHTANGYYDPTQGVAAQVRFSALQSVGSAARAVAYWPFGNLLVGCLRTVLRRISGIAGAKQSPHAVRQAAYPVHPILIASEAGGLALDVGVDIVKNAVLGNGESPQDEGIVAPILGNGLKRHGIDIGSTYLPGVHNDHGQAQVDWQW
jgi:hypothetical protein